MYSYSQIVYESGYFINESNEKVNCLIKNVDWIYNPSEFEYKISENAPIQKAYIQSIKEFEIYGASKYIKANVKIDRSSDEANTLSFERNPNFMDEQLFLKVLIEGKASLYIYESANLVRFFYKTDDSDMSQLVYKRYFVTPSSIATNNSFQQQLSKNLNCEVNTADDLLAIKYTKKDLEKFFLNYNKCTNSDYINHASTQNNGTFNLSIRPGVNFSSLSIFNTLYDTKNTDFGQKSNFRLGIEAEYILPFNKNKWAVIIEPTYQYFKAEKTQEVKNFPGGILSWELEYQSIELPIGIRHYFFLNENSKIFLNIAYVFDFNVKSQLDIFRGDGSLSTSLDQKSNSSFAFGLGYKYNNKYSIEMRYLTKRDILNGHVFWASDYQTLSVLFGYTLF